VHGIHSLPQRHGKVGKPEADATAQSSERNRKKKKAGGNKSLARARTAAVAAGGGRGPCGDKWPQQPSGSDKGGSWCLVHNSKHHSTEECQEIKKLTMQFRE
jgi:hypothetical protein